MIGEDGRGLARSIGTEQREDLPSLGQREGQVADGEAFRRTRRRSPGARATPWRIIGVSHWPARARLLQRMPGRSLFSLCGSMSGMQLRQARRRSLRSNIRGRLRAATADPRRAPAFPTPACSSGSWVERMRNSVSKRVSIVALAGPSPRLSVVPCGAALHQEAGGLAAMGHPQRDPARRRRRSGGQSRRGRAAQSRARSVSSGRAGKRKWPPHRISSRIGEASAPVRPASARRSGR